MTRFLDCRRGCDPLLAVLGGKPRAAAHVAGSGDFPGLRGVVAFYQTRRGVVVRAEVWGLPVADRAGEERIFGFHIHAGDNCGGDMDDPFAHAMAHYNPGKGDHPHHAGDLPPLFGNGGYALSVFLTDRFSADEVIGRTVILHDHPDDFTTQPSGGSGRKIACGVIYPCLDRAARGLR